MSEGVTQILIPVAAFIGIGFALIQWFLVSKVKVTSGIIENGSFNQRNRLIEEDDQETGVDSDQLVFKCAEIQNAISVGIFLYLSHIFFSYMAGTFRLLG